MRTGRRPSPDWRGMEDKLTTRQVQALETRQRIYQSAVELFIEFPYEKVKIADICRKAGVSVGVFYHYFPSKGHIFNEGYESFEKDLRAYLEGTPAGPVELVELAVERYLRSNAVHGPAYRTIFLKNQLDIKDSNYLRNAMKSVLGDCVTRAVEAGALKGEAGEITAALLRSLRGYVFDWAVTDGGFSLVEEGLKITRLLLHHYGAVDASPAGEP